MNLLLGLLLMVGMLVVVPIGLRLIDGLPDALAKGWLVGAVPGAGSLWLARGPLAAILAAPYALAALAVAGTGAARWWRRRSWTPRALALLTATSAPVVAGLALVSERRGYPLFGFPVRILALTVAHFQFAGFGAALVAALVCASTRDSPLGRVAALSVPAGIAVVLVGFFAGNAVALAGTVVLTIGMWLVGWLTWREVRPATADPVTRSLLAVSAIALVATMALALSWAFGRATGLPHPSLDTMIATHGVANALGFGLCAVLAWRRLGPGRSPGPADPQESPHGSDRSPQWTA
jgi:YndJ-like protein